MSKYPNLLSSLEKEKDEGEQQQNYGEQKQSCCCLFSTTTTNSFKSAYIILLIFTAALSVTSSTAATATARRTTTVATNNKIKAEDMISEEEILVDGSILMNENILSPSKDQGTESSSLDSVPSPYKIVFDGGSTGSRMFIYEFVSKNSPDDNDTNNTATAYTTTTCEPRGSQKAWTPLSSFGNKQLTKEEEEDSKSILNLEPYQVVSHLIPMFEYAANVIPSKYHSTTEVKYMATAGMRLLSEKQQEEIYDAVYEGLHDTQNTRKNHICGRSGKNDAKENSDDDLNASVCGEYFEFPFTFFTRDDIGTLSGDLEGFYGAVAANYIAGAIDVNLRYQKKKTPFNNSLEEHEKDIHSDNIDDDDDDDEHGPLGALDMGGSSTQLVFLPPTSHKDYDTCNSCSSTNINNKQNSFEETEELTMKSLHYEVNHPPSHASSSPSSPEDGALSSNDFFSTSYLSYGVDQFRERLWDLWIHDREMFEQQQKTQDKTNGNIKQTCISHIISNPCTFKGFTMEWKGYTLYGTGDALECTHQVRRLIPSLDGGKQQQQQTQHNNSKSSHESKTIGQVGGVSHPPIRGKFFAMSLYFFTLDSLRVLSHPAQEAYEALNLSWPNPSIQELYDALHGLCSRSWQDDLELIKDDAHEYTSPEVLPHRCIESVYMVTLLRDGFGFHPSSRDITFAYRIDGNEVEWAFGMALSLYANQS